MRSTQRPARERGEEGQPLPSSPRRVALGATLLVLVVYLVVAVVADGLAHERATRGVDARLGERLSGLVLMVRHEVSSGTAPSPLTLEGSDGDGDFDDAPVFGWWVPVGAATAVPLVRGAPALPVSLAGRQGAFTASLAGRPFRLQSARAGAGRVVAATSVGLQSSQLSTLLVIEAALLPFVLLTFYLVAYVIGRRAVHPVERARQRQLDFTTDASHELRTPLSVIEAEVGVALAVTRPAEEYRQALERVGRESLRLRSIVEDLLFLARVDALPAPARRELVDLDAVAAACAVRFAAVAARRRIRLETEPEPSRAVVSAPAEWLERLASVLVDNACRYCPPGGEVRISAEVLGGRAALTVDDSGPGIAESERSRVFQRFHRATFSPGGAGLGLSIADSVVRATQGRWEVGASPAGGARLRVSWPAAPHEHRVPGSLSHLGERAGARE